jgi:methenyltetrahydromethanopterin cyclohydrolase
MNMQPQLSPLEIAKGEAYALADELLALKGYKLSHTKCLDATAIACGFQNWNVMVAHCKSSASCGSVIVSERRAELLARHLIERRGLDVTVVECAGILRRVESMVAGLMADLMPPVQGMPAAQSKYRKHGGYYHG